MPDVHSGRDRYFGTAPPLSGTVELISEMDRIENAVWAAPGVSRVIDKLRIS